MNLTVLIPKVEPSTQFVCYYTVSGCPHELSWVTSLLSVSLSDLNLTLAQLHKMLEEISWIWKTWCPLQGVAAEGAVHTETSISTGGRTSQKNPNSIVLQNTRIATGKTNTTDITFVPKTVSHTTVLYPVSLYSTVVSTVGLHSSMHYSSL